MTDGPTTPAKNPRAARRGIKNADVPSETLGLPDVGEGASAAHFARDVPLGLQVGDDDGTGTQGAADPDDRAG